jgi:hypothetical protein
MKSANDYLQTSLWYKEKISDPYQVIAEFFFSADIIYYRKCIKYVLRAATSSRIWRKHNPGDLLHDFKMMESVINAAYLMNKANKTFPLDIKKESSFDPNLFCGWHTKFTQWDYFPRVLSFKEYVNPYLTFKRFFKFLSLQAWKLELQDLLEYSLVTTSLTQAGIEKDMLPLYFHLSKLVEAAHLIDVREINHIGGIVKNKMKLTH